MRALRPIDSASFFPYYVYMYEWLNDLPMNPPVSGTSLTRNTLQPVTPINANAPLEIILRPGDFVLEEGQYGGLRTQVTQEGSSFSATFQSNQAALEYLAWLAVGTQTSYNIYLRRSDGFLVTMKTS